MAETKNAEGIHACTIKLFVVVIFIIFMCLLLLFLSYIYVINCYRMDFSFVLRWEPIYTNTAHLKRARKKTPVCTQQNALQILEKISTNLWLRTQRISIVIWNWYCTLCAHENCAQSFSSLFIVWLITPSSKVFNDENSFFHFSGMISFFLHKKDKHTTQNVIKKIHFLGLKIPNFTVECCSNGLKIFVIKLKTVEEKLRSLSMERPVN